MQHVDYVGATAQHVDYAKLLSEAYVETSSTACFVDFMRYSGKTRSLLVYLGTLITYVGASNELHSRYQHVGVGAVVLRKLKSIMQIHFFN